jgi:Abortive infection C-terminus
MERRIKLSPASIQAVSEVISGGSGYSQSPPIGIYRSGPEIERFIRACNVDFKVSGSRCPSLEECLINLNRGVNNDNFVDADSLLAKIIEAAADPRDFIADPVKGEAVIQYLNKYLAYDGLELAQIGINFKLQNIGRNSAVVNELSKQAAIINFDTVQHDIERALKSAETDPEDALTAACSCVESVCRSIIAEQNLALPTSLDIKGLYRAVAGALGLTPDGVGNLPAEIRDDVRKILSGMFTTIEGLGSLRTHAGDAHGRKRGTTRVDPRIARFALHTASTLSVFLIETWQKKFPARELHKV